jgi:hypothetical protein
MSTYNTKNYMAHGGNELVIGGKLTILDGAIVTGLADAEQLVPATEEALGCVKAAAKAETDTVPAKIGTDGKLYVPTYPEEVTPAANQADSTATTVAALKDDLNALLAKLKTAGLMEADTTDGD